MGSAPRAHHVVGTHRHEVDADGVVAMQRDGDRALRADAVGRPDEDRLAVAGRDREGAAEPAEAARPPPGRRPGMSTRPRRASARPRAPRLPRPRPPDAGRLSRLTAERIRDDRPSSAPCSSSTNLRRRRHTGRAPGSDRRSRRSRTARTAGRAPPGRPGSTGSRASPPRRTRGSPPRCGSTR